MSTFASANLNSDDSDTDFVPVVSKAKRNRKTKIKRVRTGSESEGSSCSYSSSGSEDDLDEAGERDAKKAKLLEDEKAEGEERRRKAREEFEKLKAEAAGGSTDVKKEEVEMIEIKRPRRFAGETIYESVKIPASDPEAVAYITKAAGGKPEEHPNAGAPLLKATDSSTGLAEPSVRAPLRPKGPPRRKRQTLEQMSAALDKGKKLSTLEKSQMDWKSHTTSSSQMADELAANRRSGGYLEKRDFLDRVGERSALSHDERTQGPGS